MSTRTLYSTDEAAAAAGATVRQVRYWVDTGRFTPAHVGKRQGSRHGFSDLDIFRLRVAVRLVGNGAALSVALAAAAVAAEGSGRWLVVRWAGGAARVDDPWPHIGAGAVLVDLDTLDREVA